MRIFVVVQWVILMIGAGITRAQIVGYDTTAGGLYNGIGPIESNPEFQGDRFTVSYSGYLESISVPLANDYPFNNVHANGIVSLWSDGGNVVGTRLVSWNVTTTNTTWSSTQLPPFVEVFTTNSSPLFLTAGTSYWLTLSQTAGSGGLVGFSNVKLTSAESVNFPSGTIQYVTGNQAFVAQVAVLPLTPQLKIIPYASDVVLTWPTNYTGYTLQSTTNLGSPSSWTPISLQPVVIGGQNAVIDVVSGTHKFYRLSL